MRGSAVSLQNGGVSSSGRAAGGSRVRKHANVIIDPLDDVCFKSDTAFRLMSSNYSLVIITAHVYVHVID